MNLNFQQNLISSVQLTLIPTYNLTDKVTIELVIENECRNLLSLKNSISLRLKKNQNVFLKISEIFQGPINNLTIKGNPEIKLRNPFQSIQEIKYCKNETFLCIKQQNINKVNQTQKVMYQLSTIIFEDKTIFQIQQPNVDDNINQVFYVEDNLFFSQLEDELHIQLLQCKMEDYESCTEIQKQIIKFTNKLPLSLNIIKLNDLFKLEGEQKQIYLFIKNKNFSIIYLQDFNDDIKYIEKSQDQYVTLQRLNQESNFQFKLSILSININGSFEIFSQIINNEIQNLLPLTESIKKFQLVLSEQNDNVTIVQFLLSNQLNSFMIKLQIDVQKESIFSFHLAKQIRNPASEFQFTFDYVNERYLVLNQQISNASFFYDFQEDRQFYDYIYRLDFQIMEISLILLYLNLNIYGKQKLEQYFNILIYLYYRKIFIKDVFIHISFLKTIHKFIQEQYNNMKLNYKILMIQTKNSYCLLKTMYKN